MSHSSSARKAARSSRLNSIGALRAITPAVSSAAGISSASGITIVDADDVNLIRAVVEIGNGAEPGDRLALTSSLDGTGISLVELRDLDRDLPLELRILAQVHVAHRAFTQDAQ